MPLDRSSLSRNSGFLPTNQPAAWRPLTLPQQRSAFSQVLAQRVQSQSQVPPKRTQAPQAMMATAPRAADQGQIRDLVNEAAQKFNVDPSLINAVIETESSFNPNAVSQAGAKGLMQLMDATARGLGVTDSFDPTQNVMGGTRLLRQLLDRYKGDVSLALAAYNAGPGAVDRFGGIPPYGETQRYVPKVLAAIQRQTTTPPILAYQSVPQRSEQWR